MLIVSHDREFLDRVTERTLFLRSDGMHAFKTRFSQAREELLRRDAAAAAQARLEDKEIRRLEQAAARYKVWAVKNPDLNKRKNAVETRIARIEKERTQTYVARERRLELSDGDIDAKVALRIAGLGVTAPGGDRKLLAIDRLAIAAGDRVALLGANGAGKSTLLSVLADAFDPELEHYDSLAAVRFNPACRLVYFDQSMRDLPLDRSILDYVVDVPGLGEKDAIRSLAPAGFPFAKIDEPIGVLSHGERARLVFLKMKLLRPNMYLLDEPTNHLDIEGQEDLEQLEERRCPACSSPTTVTSPGPRRRVSWKSARAAWSKSTMRRASSTRQKVPQAHGPAPGRSPAASACKRSIAAPNPPPGPGCRPPTNCAAWSSW